MTEVVDLEAVIAVHHDHHGRGLPPEVPHTHAYYESVLEELQTYAYKDTEHVLVPANCGSVRLHLPHPYADTIPVCGHSFSGNRKPVGVYPLGYYEFCEQCLSRAYLGVQCASIREHAWD